jgi:hypothetical protein
MPYPSLRDMDDLPARPADPNTPFSLLPVDEIVFIQHTGLLNGGPPYENCTARNPFYLAGQMILALIQFVLPYMYTLPVLSQ